MDKKLILFNIDGVLCPDEDKMNEQVLPILYSFNLRNDIDIGFVEETNLNYCFNKIGDENLKLFSWKLNHNGLHKFNGVSFKDFMGEKHFMKFINIILKNLSKIEIPKKSGTFIEYKNDLLSISPIGFDSSDEEKDEFEKYDNKNSIIKKLIETIKKDWYNYCYYDEESFSSLNKIDFSIFDKISFNIFPQGHDKTTYLQLNECKEIYYFINDLNINFELLNKLTTIHNKVTIYKVKTYKDTLEKINKI